MKCICPLGLAGLLFGVALPASAITGPLVWGPQNVYDDYTLSLDPAALASGSWTIDWGDGTAPSTVPVAQTSAVHHYSSTGSREISAVLRNAAGVLVDSQLSYRELVKKIDPLVHYNFEDAAGTQHIGPAVEYKGSIASVPSFAASTGNAVRLLGGNYLSVPDLTSKDGAFFGLEFWLKPTNLTPKQVVYAGVGTGDGNPVVYIENGNLCFELTGSGVVKSVPLGSGVGAGRWYHFAVSYERSAYFKERNSLRFYRDGFLLKADTYTREQAVLVNYSGATIGVKNAGTPSAPVTSFPLSADIDEVVLHRLGVFPGAFLERYRAATSNRSSFRVASGEDGAAPFTVNPPVITQEVTVGLDPDPAVDNAVRIRLAINAATSGTRIKLVNQTTGQGGGTYYLRKAYAARLFPLENKTDIELDGNGANFIVSDWWSEYVKISGCTRVAVKNMSFDIDQNEWRVGAYAQVHSIDPANRKVVIRWVKGANQEPDVMTPKIAQAEHGLWRWRRVNGTTRRNISDEDWSVISKVPDPADGSYWTLTLHSKYDPSKEIWSTFAAMQAAGDLIQVNNCVFGPSGATVEDSEHITFDGYKIYAATGMGFLSGSFSYLKVVNSKIGLPPGLTAEDRPFATGSDGFHFHAARNGHVLFENNDVGMTDDDPISLKDGIVGSVQKMGETQLKLGLGRRMATNSFELRTQKLERLSPPFTGVITSYDAATDISTIDRPLPGNVGDKFTLQKLEEYTGNYMFRGNNIHDLNGRMMIYTPDGTFANNRFSNMLFHIGFSLNDTEACGVPYNILLSNNLFASPSRMESLVWGPTPSQPVIEDIGVSNNSFLGGYWVSAYTASPNLTNNYFEKTSVPESGRGLMYMAYNTKFATAFGNIHYDPVTQPFITKDGTSDYTAGANELIPNRTTAADVIVDNTTATFTGTWGTSSTNVGQFYGSNYRWSNTANSTVQFTPSLPTTGTYRVYAMWNGGTDRGSTVNYTITHVGGTETVSRSQRTGGGLWVYLGTYAFNAGALGNVKATTTGASGLIIADAVRFQQ